MNVGGESVTSKLDKQAKIVIDYLAEHRTAAEDDLQKLLGVKRTRAYTLTKQMADAGMIKIVGRGTDKSFVLPEN